MSIDDTPGPWIRPASLEGETVRLTPLLREHAPRLWTVGQDADIWRWVPWRMQTAADFAERVSILVGWSESGSGQSFLIESRAGGEPLGGTSYLNADQHNLRVEIGATWIAPRWQRSGVNTECKWLLLGHAFNELRANRVEFKTDSMNVRSRAALERIGAKEEGTLRNHVVRPDGSLRHSTYFSVTVEEWPVVEEHLLRLKNAYPYTRKPAI
jgi:RimJ/RimL family protein N-acetyltransferase